MNDLIFQELQPLARIQALEDNANEVIQDFVYQRPMSEEELDNLREEFATLHIEMKVIKAKMAAAVAEFKKELKEKETSANAYLTTIRTGREEISGTVYLIQDFGTGKILYYNEEGLLVSERTMLAREKQRRIQNIQTGTE
jgi:hypothetical protein